MKIPDYYNLKKFIKIIFEHLRKKRYINNLFKEASAFLKKGCYYIDPKLKFVYRDDNLTKQKLIIDFGHEFLLYTPVNKLIKIVRRFYRIKNERYKIENFNTEFNGTFLLLSNKLKSEKNYGDFKVFDFISNKILTKHISASNYNKKINAYNMFSPFFNIPNIIYFDEETNITIEKAINFVPQKKLTENNYSAIARYILSSYYHYFKKISNNPNFIKVRPIKFLVNNSLNLNALEGVKKIKGNIGYGLFNIEIPLVYQHGDLSLSNVLISEEGTCYVIDWEHANHFSFLYDIMWLWQNEAIYHDNFFFLKEYYNGNYDDLLKNIFSIFNLSYNKKYRHGYFNIVIAELLFRRIFPKGDTLSNSFINTKIVPMLSKIEQFYN